VGTQLREIGLPVVIYQTPVPVQKGVEVLGEELRQRTIDNFAAMDEAFIAGYGPIDVVQSGVVFGDDEFLDPDDGIEHFNERGRRHLADMVAEAIQKQLADLPQRSG
jgi:hypothetical protein